MSRDAENFIPWEQIAPLVTPGMTFHELGLAVVTAAGLSFERHRVAGTTPITTTLLDCLQRGGLVIYGIHEWTAMCDSGRLACMPQEVIA